MTIDIQPGDTFKILPGGSVYQCRGKERRWLSDEAWHARFSNESDAVEMPLDVAKYVITAAGHTIAEVPPTKETSMTLALTANINPGDVVFFERYHEDRNEKGEPLSSFDGGEYLVLCKGLDTIEAAKMIGEYDLHRDRTFALSGKDRWRMTRTRSLSKADWKVLDSIKARCEKVISGQEKASWIRTVYDRALARIEQIETLRPKADVVKPIAEVQPPAAPVPWPTHAVISNLTKCIIRLGTEADCRNWIACEGDTEAYTVRPLAPAPLSPAMQEFVRAVSEYHGNPRVKLAAAALLAEGGAK